MDFIKFREKIEKAWSVDTSYVPDIYVGDKATGQCAVTALAVYYKFGGDIMTGFAVIDKQKERHYWNRINGLDIDFTWRQYPAGTKLTKIKKTYEKQLRRNKNLTDRYFKLVNKSNGF